jgi:hypothetical protein
MSRYSCSYRVRLSLDRLGFLYDDILKLSVFEVTHRRADVFVLLEKPNEPMFAQLITIELFNRPVSPSEIQIELLVKNHELPLRVNNRCRRFFDRVHRIITEDYRGISRVRVSA